jgi:hypothetical protein
VITAAFASRRYGFPPFFIISDVIFFILLVFAFPASFHEDSLAAFADAGRQQVRGFYLFHAAIDCFVIAFLFMMRR